MAKFENNFSWSFSRHRLFHDCRRAYWYNYYGSWGGWDADAPDEARLAYRLKQSVNMPMWLGDLVHRMAERILGDLQNRELNTVENYQKQMRKWMNREWLQSVEGKWKWKPKYNLNLFEHYYGIEITAEERVAARDKVYRCIAHFMESPLFAELAALGPAEWKSIEKLDQFPVNDVPVFVKLDLATAPAENSVVVYDWKTGKRSDDTAVQLGCYALYAYQVWRIPLENQRLVSFYLDDNEVAEARPDASHLVETKDFILNSIEEMRATLDGPIEKNEATKENFPMTERRGKCRRCAYREMCFGTREWGEAQERT